MDISKPRKTQQNWEIWLDFHFKKYLFYFFPQDSLEIVGTCNLCYLICINIMIFSEDNLQSVDFGVLHPFTEILKKIISNECDHK